MTLQEFVAWANGKKLAKYNDGQYPGQCVSLINQYCWRVLNVPAASWGNAKDWGFNATTLRYFDKVSSKQVGDILVYPGTASNPYGHIEIFIGNGQALQQNRFLDGMTHISPVWSKAPIAILRKKGGQEVVIGSEANWRARFNRLHRQLVRNADMPEAVFKSIQGQDAWKVVENWSDHPESNTLLQYQVTGETATRDNWPGQIYSLQAALKAAQDNAAAVLADNTATKAQLKEALAKVTELENTPIIAADAVAQDTNEKVNWIVTLLQKIFK